MTDTELFAAVPDRRETGIGKRQRAMLEFLRRVNGWQTISRDSETQDVAYSLIARQLIARPDDQCSLGYIDQVRAVENGGAV